MPPGQEAVSSPPACSADTSVTRLGSFRKTGWDWSAAILDPQTQIWYYKFFTDRTCPGCCGWTRLFPVGEWMPSAERTSLQVACIEGWSKFRAPTAHWKWTPLRGSPEPSGYWRDEGVGHCLILFDGKAHTRYLHIIGRCKSVLTLWQALH